MSGNTHSRAVDALKLHAAYEAVPGDRGGANGPKGKALAAWIAARDAVLASLPAAHQSSVVATIRALPFDRNDDYPDVRRDERERIFAALPAASEGEVDHLRHVIDRDRYIVAAGTSAIQNVIRGRAWLFEGRGPYEWDDDDYRKEFGAALADIEKVMEPLRRVAWDKSDCTKIEERVIAAKAAAGDLLKQPLGPRNMIAADIGLPDARDAEIARLRTAIDNCHPAPSDQEKLAKDIEAELQRWKGANGGVYTIRAASLAIVAKLIRARQTTPAVSGEGWRPIETAPKDGWHAPILTCCIGDPVAWFDHEPVAGYAQPPSTAYWNEHGDCWTPCQRPHDVWEPTHWMPLLAPPTNRSQIGGAS